jgi:hypothetical protein
MQKYVRIENNEVKECVDSLPENAVGDWRIAIEIDAEIIQNRQIRSGHYFDINKSPVEIVWTAIDLTIEDRKEYILQQLNQKFYKIVSEELLKEFSGQDSNFLLVQSSIQTYREKRIEINSLTTHEEIDVFMSENV